MKIIFDMDGTIADFYGVEGWLNSIEHYDPKPYIEAKPLWDMVKLAEEIKRLRSLGHTIAVVSWLSKSSTKEFDTATRRAKRAWLKSYGLEFDEIHLVKYGTPKSKFKATTVRTLYFDDSAEVREEVIGKNCVAVNPMVYDIVEYLSRME